MEAGEKEMRKAFERVNTGNVRAAVDHGNETRKMVREIQKKVDHLEANIIAQDEKFEQINKQVASILAKVYSGGTA